MPAYQVPLQVSDNYANDPFNIVAIVDPNLNRPYVQQYSIGIQHDFKGTVFEARYVGNHVVGAYRAFDFNQVQIVQNGFLADFLRAQNNGFLARGAGRRLQSRATTPASPAASRSPSSPSSPAAGSLTDATMRQTYSRPARPANWPRSTRPTGCNGSVNFFQNPNALAADMLTNYSSSSYNSLQLAARHRTRVRAELRRQLHLLESAQRRRWRSADALPGFPGLQQPQLERSRANFDLNHMIKADGYYELPFGKGHKLSFGRLDRVIGGWIFGSTMVWQSGAPFSILSGRGTLNREARSYYNTANTASPGAAQQRRQVPDDRERPHDRRRPPPSTRPTAPA